MNFDLNKQQQSWAENLNKYSVDVIMGERPKDQGKVVALNTISSVRVPKDKLHFN